MRIGGLIFSMVRICTGEVWVRSSNRSRCGLDSWLAMKRVSCVSRAGWLSGKVQRFEVVVVSLNHRAFLHGVAEIAEDGDDFVHRLDDGMLGADGALDAGKSDVYCIRLVRHQ